MSCAYIATCTSHQYCTTILTSGLTLSRDPLSRSVSDGVLKRRPVRAIRVRFGPKRSRSGHVSITWHVQKLSCRREAARCFVSLNISVSYSRSLKVIGNSTPFDRSHMSSYWRSISNYDRGVVVPLRHLRHVPPPPVLRLWSWLAFTF